MTDRNIHTSESMEKKAAINHNWGIFLEMVQTGEVTWKRLFGNDTDQMIPLRSLVLSLLFMNQHLFSGCHGWSRDWKNSFDLNF